MRTRPRERQAAGPRSAGAVARGRSGSQRPRPCGGCVTPDRRPRRRWARGGAHPAPGGNEEEKLSGIPSGPSRKTRAQATLQSEARTRQGTTENWAETRRGSQSAGRNGPVNRRNVCPCALTISRASQAFSAGCDSGLRDRPPREHSAGAGCRFAGPRPFARGPGLVRAPCSQRRARRAAFPRPPLGRSWHRAEGPVPASQQRKDAMEKATPGTR